MMMARKPNYDFERKERDRLKAQKKAKRAADKAEARGDKPPQSESPDQGGDQGPGSPTTE
jgi:hypothetical protein